MNALMRRRGMMQQKIEKFLYPLTDGYKALAYQVTTSSDGHIKVYNPKRQTAGKYLNFRDPEKYFTTISNSSTVNCPTWFTLYAGQTVTFESLNLPSIINLKLYKANTVEIYKNLTGSTKSITFTVEEDTEIGCVGATTNTASAAGRTHEFDISLNVDGRRYF